MASRPWLSDFLIAAAISLLGFLVVQFSRGTGIEFVYFAF